MNAQLRKNHFLIANTKQVVSHPRPAQEAAIGYDNAAQQKLAAYVLKKRYAVLRELAK